jgi:hypothetical protein
LKTNNITARYREVIFGQLLSCRAHHVGTCRSSASADGEVVAIVERTNNVLEHFFGAEKRRLRRRLGRAHLRRDLEDQPAQAALAANLRHPDYVHVLCGNLDQLPMAFSELDEQALAQATPLTRSNRDTKLQKLIRARLKDENRIDLSPKTENLTVV